MRAKYPLGADRRIERPWAERVKSLKQLGGRIASAMELMLQRGFSDEGLLIPIPVRTVDDRRRLDQRRPRD
jgi:hypothetical protein